MFSTRSVFTTALTVVVLATGLSLGTGQADAATRTLVIRQASPVLAHVDLHGGGPTHGDMLAFEAKFASDDGSGVMMGLLITVDLPEEGDVFEDRLGQFVFDFGEGNSIVGAGASVYAPETQEMNHDHPQVRVVLGGTGRYLGIRGQITTVRSPDGSYEHKVELVE